MKKKLLKSDNKTTGFTLIELLVVIAIIGILSAVVVASLNSAREKGKITSIKGNLKSIMTQAELFYSDNGSYSSLCINSTGVCTGSIARMCDTIISLGTTTKCYSHDGTRWGVTVKNNTSTNKNYSADSSGIVTWDTSDISTSTMNWNTANTTCASAGSRLPSIEEIKSLWDSYGVTPPNFPGTYYWSGTLRPTDSNLVYIINMTTGNIYGPDVGKGNLYYVRCVR